VDPLLLAGMVRVALDKVESGTKVVVRVHPEQVSDCRSYFARTLEPGEVPEVVEDAAIARDCCVLQTGLGTTELGLEVQLKEIEKGLMDLMARRPEAAK
jgi:flagellar assembly protein FliH